MVSHQVYLARKEGTSEASISWKFEVKETDYVIEHVSVKFTSQCFEDGHAIVTLCDEDKCVAMESSGK